ncbi:4-hydroxy-3-methylbut-2-enyl diphosphate reductase [Sphingomonas sp. XMGL2]|uniref:4-hydroxy-3-methylbut-2-enyl diphosphate reductase n=1 Tax=Sphingomonas quercus TaxID=2842451 RepID=A0ABS6BMB8_9SPHN|nr:4-hydroxy-3-methylbut-2-enyl diphosphate reductase [Sphingomonas quercus]
MSRSRRTSGGIVSAAVQEKFVHVILAQPRGFCAGVVRAIEIVERALDMHKAPVYVRHEIVHNRHVVDKLRSKGAIFVEDLADVPQGALTIFSAHGVARSVQDEARERGLPVLDATCPLVTKVHVQGRRYMKMGRTLVLIGHEGHAEVIGTMGQIDGPIHLVSTAEDVDALDLAADTPVAYVTQTTLSVDDTRGVIAALHARFADVVGPDVSDICYATQNRQTAVRDLCRVVDLLLVVGSANSSNSNRLREIGVEMGVPSHLVADGDALDPAWLAGVDKVGLTAGASAPDELVETVIAALRRIGPVQISSLDGVEENIEFSLPPELKSVSSPSLTAA